MRGLVGDGDRFGGRDLFGLSFIIFKLVILIKIYILLIIINTSIYNTCI